MYSQGYLKDLDRRCCRTILRSINENLHNWIMSSPLTMYVKYLHHTYCNYLYYSRNIEDMAIENRKIPF